MKNFDISQLANIFTNPLYIAGVRGNNPNMGNNLAAAAMQQREQEQFNMQRQEFQQKQQEQLRQQQIAQMLPGILKDIDFSDYNSAFKELTSKGVDPQTAIKLIGGLTDVETQKGNLELNRELRRGNLDVSRGNLGVNQAQLGIEREKLGLSKQKQAYELANPIGAEDAYKIEKDLREAAAKETKNYKFVKTAVKNILSNSKHKNAISDTAMVYNFVNVLDPGNSVREGDTITIAKAPGISEQWRAKLNKALGEGGLTETTRNEIIQSSKSILKNHHESVGNINKESERLAKSYKVNPDNVTYPLEEVGENEETDFTPQTTNTNQFSGNSFTKEQLMKERERRRTMNTAPDRGL